MDYNIAFKKNGVLNISIFTNVAVCKGCKRTKGVVDKSDEPVWDSLV